MFAKRHSTHVMYPVARDLPATTTITKLMQRSADSVSCSLTTTLSSTLTITSTVYNSRTVTRTSLSAGNNASSAVKAATVKPPLAPAPSAPKSTSAQNTKTTTTTHTSALTTATKNLISTTNKNSTTPAKESTSHGSAGRAAGITLGTVAGAVLIFWLVITCCRRRRRKLKIEVKKKSEKHTSDSPAVEAGERKKYVFKTKHDDSNNKYQPPARNTYYPPSHDNGLPSPSTQAYLGASGMVGVATSRLSRIHPAFRYPKQVDGKSNRMSQPRDSKTMSDTSRFYSSDNIARDSSLRSETTHADRATNNNVYYSPWSNIDSHAPAFRPAYTPPPPKLDAQVAPAGSVTSTPIDKIGPSAPLLGYDPIDFAHDNSYDNSKPITTQPPPPQSMSMLISTSNSNTNQQSASSTPPSQLPQTTYVLPSIRPSASRGATPSVWTDASIPLTEFDHPPPMPPLPPILPLSTSSASRTIPASSNVTASHPSFITFGPVSSGLKNTTITLPTSGTTTESDVSSPRHEGQEPSRRRKSLFQSLDGSDVSGKEDDDDVKKGSECRSSSGGHGEQKKGSGNGWV